MIIGLIIMVNKDLEKWFSNYPDLVPCKYCIYFRTIGRGDDVTPSFLRAQHNYDSFIAIAPACYYGLIHNECRGDLPLDGKCAKFIARHHYKHLQEVYKK